jgi:tripartite-type tricarboxylate transporter receptor subunit TctC
MVAPFVAGSGADAYARMLGKKLTDLLHQQVIVDNRPGAQGIIGTEIAARATPNGYTIAFITGAHVANAAMNRDLPYDPVADFQPISLFTVFPFFLVTSPSFPPRTVPELVAAARAKPGEINYASAGAAQQFAAEMLKAYAKVDITHVGYKGLTAGAINDVMSGAVQMMFQGPTIMPHVAAGKLRALAVTTAKRSPMWPDVPTIREGGVANYEFTNWHGLVAPRGTPQPIVARLNQAVVQALQDRSIARILVADGAELHGSTPPQFWDYFARDLARYQEIARAIGGIRAN